MPTLSHLPPPRGCGALWLERYSPLFEDPGTGLTSVRPANAYGHVYPPSADMHELAYFFEYDTGDRVAAHLAQELIDGVKVWRDAWASGPVARPKLRFRRGGSFVIVSDTRTGVERRATLKGWRSEAFLACNIAQASAKRIASDVAEKGYQISVTDVERFLKRCVEAGLVVEDNGRYLNVAVPVRFPTSELRSRTSPSQEPSVCSADETVMA